MLRWYSGSSPLNCGHGEETTVATIEWSAAAGLPTAAIHYKLVASVGSLPP